MVRRKKPDWWGYVKRILEEYPTLANKDAMDVSEKDKRKMKAVEYAMQKNITYKNSRERMQIITMVYFKKTHTIEGAALKIPCHPNTAGRWQADFIYWTAEKLDLP